jgi:hypothetical protein
MKTLSRLTVAAAIIGLTAATAAAQVVNQNVNVNANVNSRAKLTVGGGPVAFADADPDVTPSIAAGVLTISVKARTGGAASPTLTVIADNDLISGSDVISIDNITWTVGGAAGFAGGTMDKTVAQTLGSWIGSGNHSDSQIYSLANSWDYATGAYSATITYTLTVP